MRVRLQPPAPGSSGSRRQAGGKGAVADRNSETRSSRYPGSRQNGRAGRQAGRQVRRYRQAAGRQAGSQRQAEVNGRLQERPGSAA